MSKCTLYYNTKGACAGIVVSAYRGVSFVEYPLCLITCHCCKFQALARESAAMSVLPSQVTAEACDSVQELAQLQFELPNQNSGSN